MKVFVTNSAGNENEVYKEVEKQVKDFISKGKHSWLLGGEGGIADRIYRMEMADVIIVLPGDMRTLHDLYAAIESKRIEEHHSPILIANINGYFDKALLMIDESIDEGFTEESTQGLYDVVHTSEELSGYLKKLKKM